MRKREMALIVGILIISGITMVLAADQNVTVVILPGGIDVASPVQGEVYESRMVPINLTMSTKAKYFKYQDNDGRIKTLCRNCDEYGLDRLKRKPFDDGFHELKIIAVFPDEEIHETINFTVETRKPKIKKTAPTRGYSDGTFTVEFEEANPRSVFLTYGNSDIEQRSAEVSLNTCTTLRAKRTECSINVNLTDYDSSKIEYSFNITDILGKTDTSRTQKVDVDVTKPVIINNMSFWTQGTKRRTRYIYFNFSVDEENFDSISYYDYSKGDNARWRKLCNRLKDSRCEKRKSFRRGNHTLDIKISDKAGNVGIIEKMKFEVNY